MKTSIQKWFYFLILPAIGLNAIPMYFGWKNNLLSEKGMKEFFLRQYSSDYTGFVFKDCCMKQYENFKGSDQNDFVFSEVVITTITELFLMILVGILSYLAIVNKSNAPIRKSHLIWGFSIGQSLFAFELYRYYWTSIAANEKQLFTTSSYCFQGDLALLISSLGYLLMYTALALGIARFISLSIDALKKNSLEENRVINDSESLRTICKIYTWLPYFSYAGFTVWIAGTGITGTASEMYLNHAILITTVLVIVFFACLRVLVAVSSNFNKMSTRKSSDGMTGCNEKDSLLDRALGPFGSNAFNTFIRIVFPFLIFLSLYYKLFDIFTK